MLTAGAMGLMIGGQAAAQLRQPRASSLFPSAQSSSASPTIQSGQSPGFSKMKPGQTSEINPQPLPPGGKRNGVTPKPSAVHIALGKITNPEAAVANAHDKLVMESHSEAAAPRGPGGHARMGGTAMMATVKDGIALVNRRDKGIVVTPGGQYVIVGHGFGDKSGRVRLIDRTIPQGSLDFLVVDWQPGAITVDLPAAISGLPDLSGAILQVTAADGTLYTKPDIAFYAARSATDYTTADPQVPHLFGMVHDARWPVDSGRLFVQRWMTGNDINCPNPGSDQAELALKPGWTWTNAWIIQGTPATGDPDHSSDGEKGDTVVSGSYQLALEQQRVDPNARFQIGWGVYRSHRGEGNGVRTSVNDFCESTYDIGVTLVGPAGTSPF
jgi:hypothetical protein